MRFHRFSLRSGNDAPSMFRVVKLLLWLEARSSAHTSPSFWLTRIFCVALSRLHQARPAASAASTKKAPQASTAATSVEEKQEPEGIPIDELEAKMSSVRKALERFDTVKVWLVACISIPPVD